MNYTKEEIEILRKYYPCGGCKEVQKHIIRTNDSIRHKAKSLDITRIEGFRCSKVDFSWLINMETCNAAYVLGLIWGDGCIQSDGKRHYSISITLNEKDFEEVKHLFVGFHVYKIKKQKNTWKQCFAAQIGHKKLYEFLYKYDYKIKSLTSPEKILSRLPEYLRGDFIRGWFDADGCSVSLAKNRGIIDIAGSYNQDWFILEKICLEKDIKYTIKRQIAKNGRGSRFSITGYKNIFKFAKLIYNGNQEFLKRKYLNFIILKENLIQKINKFNSKYMGVIPKKYKKTGIRFTSWGFKNGVNKYIGVFNTEDIAALEYNKWAEENGIQQRNEIGKNFYIKLYGLDLVEEL